MNEESQGIEALKGAISISPNLPGVYKMISGGGEILYIGKAKNLKNRLSSYLRTQDMPNRLKLMVSLIRKVEYHITKTESESLLLEASLIKAIKPRFNIELKDDKEFPYITLDASSEFPRISKFRGKKQQNQKYYGPFSDVKAVNNTITEIQKLFLIRPCSDSFFSSRKKPCLQYQIKRCSAPCVGKITKEDYASSIKNTISFLNGNSIELQKTLQLQMQKASELMEYEKAAAIRDRISTLSKIQSKSLLKTDNLIDCDIFAVEERLGEWAVCMMLVRNGHNNGVSTFHQHNTFGMSRSEVFEQFCVNFYQDIKPPKHIIAEGIENADQIKDVLSSLYEGLNVVIKSPKSEKYICDFLKENAVEFLNKKIKAKDILKEIALLFEMEEIRKIDVYDNSHISGTNMIAAVIVADQDGFVKNEYRKYNLNNSDDDYASLKYILSQRAHKSTSNLLLVDGGLGQLSAAYSVLKDLVDSKKITLVCISKGEYRNAGREWFHMIGKKSFQLPINDPKLHYLQNLRDEAHRFAIKSHRQKRSKEFLKSDLELIPGVGKKRIMSILNHFGSLENVKNSNVEDIARVDGISKKIAKTIFDYLRDI